MGVCSFAQPHRDATSWGEALKNNSKRWYLACIFCKEPIVADGFEKGWGALKKPMSGPPPREASSNGLFIFMAS